jgi:GNAT superfamily N-acetyltransferase
MSLGFREAEEADRPFVIGSWIASYRCAHAAGLISMDDWRDIMQVQITKVLDRSGCRVVVAYNPDEDDKRLDLHGWICFERNYLVPTRTRNKAGRYEEELKPSPEPLCHYIFLKQAYRRAGLARQLFAAADIDLQKPFAYTCRTSIVSKAGHLIPRASWRPLIARFPKPDPTTQRGQNARDETDRR